MDKDEELDEWAPALKNPSWPINEEQEVQVRAIVKDYVAEHRLREGFEYRPKSCSRDKPVLIQEYFRLFLTPTEIFWEGGLDPKDDYLGEKTLVEKIRGIVPGFASRQS